jgi:hypothetical protein
MRCRLRPKVVHRFHSGDHGRERRGDLRVGVVGPMIFAIDLIFVNRGVKRGLNLRRGTGKLDDVAAVGNLPHGETVRAQPRRDGLQVFFGWTELRSVFLGRQPTMEIGRILDLLLHQQIFDSGFLRVAVLEDQEHAVHREVGRRGAAVESGLGHGVGVAVENGEAFFVDGLGNSALQIGCLAGCETCDGENREGEKQKADRPVEIHRAPPSRAYLRDLRGAGTKRADPVIQPVHHPRTGLAECN